MSEVQGTLKDITPARLSFSCHEHQVVVDEHCDLKEARGGAIIKRKKGTKGSRR